MLYFDSPPVLLVFRPFNPFLHHATKELSSRTLLWFPASSNGTANTVTKRVLENIRQMHPTRLTVRGSNVGIGSAGEKPQTDSASSPNPSRLNIFRLNMVSTEAKGMIID